jgi:hypothetical protein
MRRMLVTLALVMAACRPPHSGVAATNIDIPAPSAHAITGAQGQRSHEPRCRTVATDMWDSGTRPDSSMSTSVRFDSAGRVVFAVEKRKLSVLEPTTTATNLVWSPAGELTSADAVTTRPSGETYEHTTFEYGPHHELVAVTLTSQGEAKPKRVTFEWKGTFEPATPISPREVPSLAIPGFYRPLPETLVAPSTLDPMPPISFTGSVATSAEGEEPYETFYEHGRLMKSLKNGKPFQKNSFDDDGRILTSATEGISTSIYTWDRGRIVHEVIDAEKYRDEVSYEYDAAGRLARLRMVDSDGKPVADETWSNVCPADSGTARAPGE